MSTLDKIEEVRALEHRERDQKNLVEIYCICQKFLDSSEQLTIEAVSNALTPLGVIVGEKIDEKYNDTSLREALVQVQISTGKAHLVTGDNITTKVANTLDTSSSPASPKSHNPFEGTEIQSLPEHVRDSWDAVQKLSPKLSPEKQSKISYYEKAGEWFINLNGTKISLQNESANSDPKNGINVAGGNSYFSQDAARKHADAKNRKLPTNTLWSEMAAFLGEGNEGFKNLKDILQIKLNGWFLPGHGFHCSGVCAGVWSAVDRECLYVDAIDGDVYHAGNSACGRSVRLLDA